MQVWSASKMSDLERERTLAITAPDKTPQEVLEARKWFSERRGATIYPVPPDIYASDKKAYEPKVVCIGPFSYGSKYEEHLESMQYYKEKCMKKLMPGEVLQQNCLTMMTELVPSVRKKYSKKFRSPLDADHEFAQMLMLDGSFLLHLLRRYAHGAEEAEVDEHVAMAAYGRLWIWELVRYDLLLLQNQIPFFVIQRLHEFLYPDDNNTNLVDCAINFFSVLDPCRKQKPPKFYIPVEQVHHLLHLVYLSVLPCPQDCKSFPKKQSPQWIPSATELRLDGMKFKRRKKATGFLSFLDVKFSDGVMEIPQLKVHDYSVSLFRNFIAFEQCYPGTQSQITIYAFFMNFLINTEKDVRLLHLKDILINYMSLDKDAQNFFSRLCDQVHCAQDMNYLRKLFSDVTEYHDSKWHKWRAEFYRQYFKSPLTILTLVAGAIALCVSIFGTFYNVATRH